MSKTNLWRIAIVFVVLAPILSACSARRANESNKVEVFSWWTEGKEAAGLEALNKVFQTQYPDLEFVNVTAGDAESTARRVLTTRLQAGKPPDSWQGHAGQELIGAYVADEKIVPLNDIYKEEGWLDIMPIMLFPLISQNGNIYSIPVSIHRTNMLWYNPSVLEANSVSVPTTLQEWFGDMDTLQAAGVTPLALGDRSTKMLLLETILLATLGPEKYYNLWDGSSNWTGADVTAALENYQKALTYTDSDSDSLSWQDTAQTVVNGDAAFYVMGDWVESYFRELGKKPNTDYDWAPVPGSDGIFQFMSDSFVLAVNAPHREGTIAWLKVAGSKEGQEAVNPINGSICARTDCDESLFSKYQQSAMEDWSSNIIVGSLTYGVVANDSWKTDIDSALGLYLKDGDLAAFQTALTDACKNSGPCE